MFVGTGTPALIFSCCKKQIRKIIAGRASPPPGCKPPGRKPCSNRLAKVNRMLPRRGLFFRAGSRKKPSDLPLKCCLPGETTPRVPAMLGFTGSQKTKKLSCLPWRPLRLCVRKCIWVAGEARVSLSFMTCFSEAYNQFTGIYCKHGPTFLLTFVRQNILISFAVGFNKFNYAVLAHLTQVLMAMAPEKKLAFPSSF